MTLSEAAKILAQDEQFIAQHLSALEFVQELYVRCEERRARREAEQEKQVRKAA